MNMGDWFSTEERVARLGEVAGSWVGTPFFPNGDTKGPDGGVSCQKLVAGIYREVGFCEVEAPEAAMGHARFSRRAVLELYMAERTEFRALFFEGRPEAGDMLGFRIGGVVHHAGVCLGGGKFVHAIWRVGVRVSSLGDGTWGSRLAMVWRAVEC